MIKPGMTVTRKAAMRRAFKAIVQDKRVVEQGRMAVIERGKTALVIMETVLRYPCQQKTMLKRPGAPPMCFAGTAMVNGAAPLIRPAAAE